MSKQLSSWRHSRTFKNIFRHFGGRFLTDAGLGRMPEPYRKFEKSTQILISIKLKNRSPTPLSKLSRTRLGWSRWKNKQTIHQARDKYQRYPRKDRMKYMVDTDNYIENTRKTWHERANLTPDNTERLFKQDMNDPKTKLHIRHFTISSVCTITYTIE